MQRGALSGARSFLPGVGGRHGYAGCSLVTLCQREGRHFATPGLTGLQRLDQGRVALDGTVLEDPATRIRVPPEKRPVALMFQDYLPFPHLTAPENVTFGPRSQGMDRASARQKAMAALDRLGLTAVAGAKPGACPAASSSGSPWRGRS